MPFFIRFSIRSIQFASSAGGLRNRNAAAFSPLKKFAAHFFNPAFGVTGENEAANPVTGVNSRKNSLTLLIANSFLWDLLV